MDAKGKPDLIVIPYRDQYFLSEYGPAVRDLQFIKTISEFDFFDTITVVNRPVSIYERVLGKLNSDLSSIPGVNFVDATSLDLFGPLRGRAWAKTCFAKTIKTLLSKYNKNGKAVVVLDFSPFATFPLLKSSRVLYWYDLIDNFTKHNRYTRSQRELVRDKYAWVDRCFNAVTGVTSEALISFNTKKTVLPNGIFYNDAKVNKLTVHSNIYDFGFIGFITDKLDLSFIKKLSENYSIALYGLCLDKKVLARIKSMSNVHYFGKFQYNDIGVIVKTFKIGLLPYLKEKSHDESPLKLYEYFKHNLPCVTSIDYEIQSEFVFNYNHSEITSEKIRAFACLSGSCKISESIEESWHVKVRLKLFLKELLVKFDLNSKATSV
ncbi:hypothetical protein [Pseudomonas umsongensis]|uniref:hypothetical protein n=1 Tax=Pseudomonas umsongensis TaxID=198618 RepID=UPI0003A5C597|nr:hypothetical protein [Pseudomonas umsongensis]